MSNGPEDQEEDPMLAGEEEREMQILTEREIYNIKCDEAYDEGR